VQFREEPGDLGSVGATVYLDIIDFCLFNPDYESESSLRTWLIDNSYCNRQMRPKFLEAYRQYRRKIQGVDDL